MPVKGANIRILGERSEYVTVPYDNAESIMAYLKTGYFHVHGASFIYPDKCEIFRACI